MKTHTLSVLSLAAAVSLLWGCTSTPPTPREQRLFDIQTNYTPVIQVQTNVITRTLYQTNEVVVTNITGVIEYRTNLLPILIYETNIISRVVTNESYVYTPGEGAKEIQAVGREIGNLFGLGDVVGFGLGALFSIWAFFRSKKAYTTAANIAQAVETMREFIRSLPNGAVYDNELVNWMQKHQAEAGVLSQVIALLQKEVSNPDAKAAAENVKKIIEGLLVGAKN